MIGFSSKVHNVPTHGRVEMARRSMPTSLGPLLSSKFLTLGRRRIRVGTVVQVRDVMTGAVIREMTVVLVQETVDAMTVVTQDRESGLVAVTVMMIKEETETGRVINGEAGTLVGEVETVLMESPSKF
jgi:hypothetical protein